MYKTHRFKGRFRMVQLQSNWLEAKVASQAELEAKIADVNARLDRYTSSITQHDYALAIASGVLCGAIDSLYVGEFKVTQKDIGDAHAQVNRFVENFANKAGFEAEPGKKAHLKDRVEFLEQKFKVAQDSVYVNNTTHISHKDHHLADLAHHPTPVGLMSAIVVQFLRVGTFVNREGKWFFVPVDKSPQEFAKNLAAAWMPAIVAGLLNWLVTLAKDHLEERNPEMPEALWKLVRLIASTPLLMEVLGVATNWFGHLVSDVAGSKQTAGGGMGIPGVFMSLLYEVAALPGVNKTGLLQVLDDFYKSPDYKFNLRKELLNRIAKLFFCITCRNQRFQRRDQLIVSCGIRVDLGNVNTFLGQVIDISRCFQLRIGTGDGVGIDPVFSRQLPYRRKPVPGFEDTGFDETQDLSLNLFVDGNLALKIQKKHIQHLLSVLTVLSVLSVSALVKIPKFKNCLCVNYNCFNPYRLNSLPG